VSQRAGKRFASRTVRAAVGACVAALLACITGELGSRSYFWTVSLASGRPDRVTLEGRLQEYDATLGFRLIPNSQGRLWGPEFDTVISINGAGVRQDSLVPHRRTPGTRRLLAIGDSFTFGHGVDVADRFTERLGADLPGLEVVNMGVWGTGTDQQLLLYSNEGVKYAPDLTILCYMVENIVRNGVDHRTQPDGRLVGKPRFVLERDALRLTGVPVPREFVRPRDDEPEFGDRWSSGVQFPFKRFLREHSALYRLTHRGLSGPLHRALGTETVPFPEYATDRQEWLVTAAIIRAFAETAAANGSNFLLVVIPTIDYVLKSYAKPGPNELIERLAAATGIPLLDLTPELKRVSQDGTMAYFPQDGHWTPEGHAVVARALARFLGAHPELMRRSTANGG
jgi:SGNH hydrolase-like domain, acetyltransferase AlgX